MKAYCRLLVALFGLLLSVYADHVNQPPTQTEETTLFKNTVVLTEKNINEVLKPGEVWVITFYVYWCKFAAEFSPEL